MDIKCKNREEMPIDRESILHIMATAKAVTTTVARIRSQLTEYSSTDIDDLVNECVMESLRAPFRFFSIYNT